LNAVIEQSAVRQAGQRVAEGHPLQVQVGLVKGGSAFGNPLLEVLVHLLQLIGKQVDAGDDGIHGVPGRGRLQPRG
jgi:hypothetical protein